MRPIIEFCTNNMHHGTETLMKNLEKNLDFDVIEYGCLGNCGECYLAPYALVNGESIASTTVGQLDTAIHAKIKEIEEMYNLFAEE